MMLEARQAFPDTDTTMQNPTDFRDLYRRKVMLPEVGGRVYVLLHGNCWAEVEVGSSSKIDADVVEERWTSPKSGAIALIGSSVQQGRLPEAEPEVWRGIFSPTYHRKILFSEIVELQTAKLPRLKPRITLDRRMLSREEDD